MEEKIDSFVPTEPHGKNFSHDTTYSLPQVRHVAKKAYMSGYNKGLEAACTSLLKKVDAFRKQEDVTSKTLAVIFEAEAAQIIKLMVDIPE